MRWMYKCVSLGAYMPVNEYLNERGAEGWELVAATVHSEPTNIGSGHRQVFDFIFKQPVFGPTSEGCGGSGER